MSEETEAARNQRWKMSVMRARQSQAFLKTDLWNEVYQVLADKQDRLKAEVLWSPTSQEFDPGRVALKVAFASGRDFEIGELLRIFQRWHTEGQEAEVKLKEMGVEI